MINDNKNYIDMMKNMAEISINGYGRRVKININKRVIQPAHKSYFISNINRLYRECNREIDCTSEITKKLKFTEGTKLHDGTTEKNRKILRFLADFANSKIRNNEYILENHGRDRETINLFMEEIKIIIEKLEEIKSQGDIVPTPVDPNKVEEIDSYWDSDHFVEASLKKYNQPKRAPLMRTGSRERFGDLMLPVEYLPYLKKLLISLENIDEMLFLQFTS